jgi:hypothetical protein
LIPVCYLLCYYDIPIIIIIIIICIVFFEVD